MKLVGERPMKIVYIGIGSSNEDKMSQNLWVALYEEVEGRLTDHAVLIHRSWVSVACDPERSACWQVVIEEDNCDALQDDLAETASFYEIAFISWDEVQRSNLILPHDDEEPKANAA